MTLEKKIAAAVEALQQGKPVIVLDDASRENEADVILSAATVTEQWVAWTVRHSSGVLCVPLTNERADELALPPMVDDSEDPYGTAYTVSVDAASGITTGISAADRLRTIRVLANEQRDATDLRRPGHIFPLRAKEGGVLTRRGHTEAAVDLCQLAKLPAVGLICELVHDHGPVMRTEAAHQLAAEHNLPVLTIEELVEYRVAQGQAGAIEQTAAAPSEIVNNSRVTRVADAILPTAYGTFTTIAYHDELAGVDHVALIADHADSQRVVRVHSECLTGDALGSLRCDCGPQLNQALRLVAERGGAVIYMTGHEGRGIGLSQKIAAYALQDTGLDTVDANLELGLPVDSRQFGAAAAILQDLGINDITLLTNNPQKVAQLEAHGIAVEKREPLYVGVGAHNDRYLRSKAERLGHEYHSETGAADVAAREKEGAK